MSVTGILRERLARPVPTAPDQQVNIGCRTAASPAMATLRFGHGECDHQPVPPAKQGRSSCVCAFVRA